MPIKVVSKANSDLVLQQTGLLVVPVRGAKALERIGKVGKSGGDLRSLDHAQGGRLSRMVENSRFKGGTFETLLVSAPSGLAAENLLLVGWEDASSGLFEEVQSYRKLGAVVSEVARRVGASKMALLTTELKLGRGAHVQALLEGIHLSAYRFDKYKSKPDPLPVQMEELELLGAKKVSSREIEFTEALCDATALARNLVNMPARDCTPSYITQVARNVSKEVGLKFEIFDHAHLKKLGAHALLAVAQGSDEPPFLIRLTYNPKKGAKKRIALVGKGVTFDSGGLSIKSAGSMEGMKIDMSGAAAVLGAMKSISVLRPHAEVRAYIPTVENMISGSATRPGDIVKAMNGKTIEILNTDAEGRLILADALSLAVKDGCQTIVDIATLTGACVVALGEEYAGLFSNDNSLANHIIEAGAQSGERFWRLPLAREYVTHIKSAIADIKNTGSSKGGGAIAGANFLREFVGESRWAHLDIAGPASSDGDRDHVRKGGVGFGVRTLARWLATL